MIIGLTGPAFSGKNTVGDHLSFAHNFQCAAFADPIRAGLIAMFGLTAKSFGPEFKEVKIEWIGKSPRQLMQTLGTEWGRNLVNRDLWTDLMALRIKHATDLDEDIAITDVRFSGEAALIRRLGGEIWRIERPDAATTAHSSHASERAQDALAADRILINDGTLEQLKERIDLALYTAIGIDASDTHFALTK